MTYYCNDCGMIIRDEDVTRERCYLAEAWGRPIYETYLLCPSCGEPVEEFYGERYDEETGEEIEVYNNEFIEDD